MGIVIKSPQEIAIMRQAGRILAESLKILCLETKPGMKTIELDLIAAREVEKRGAIASFKGYKGFPANLCVSVNEEIVHGIPGERVLREGDIVSMDIGAIYQGFQADTAITVGVGNIKPETQRLMKITEEALWAGITAAKLGARLGDISAAIQNYAESNGFSVIREYTGHGIGRELHEDPQVPNFGHSGEGPLLQRGMTLALEPMITNGDWRTKIRSNRWTVVTADSCLAAHFEHTIAVSNTEAEVLTLL